jgi:hypothetical protein
MFMTTQWRRPASVRIHASCFRIRLGSWRLFMVFCIFGSTRSGARTIQSALLTCINAHSTRHVGSARLAQEAEGSRSLINPPNRISEGPPRGGLSVFPQAAAQELFSRSLNLVVDDFSRFREGFGRG